MKTFDIALHKKKVYDLVVGRCPAVSRIDIHSLPVRLMTSAASRMIFTQTLTAAPEHPLQLTGRALGGGTLRLSMQVGTRSIHRENFGSDS